jgi:hypothetical protein
VDFYNLAAKVGKTADGERLTAHGMAQLLLSNGKKSLLFYHYLKKLKNE